MIIDESIIALNGPGAHPIFNSTPTLTFVLIGLVILKGGGTTFNVSWKKKTKEIADDVI